MVTHYPNVRLNRSVMLSLLESIKRVDSAIVHKASTGTAQMTPHGTKSAPLS